MVQHGDSTVYVSRIGDRRLRYPGKLRRDPVRRRKKNDVIAQENARMLARLNNVRPSKQLAPGRGLLSSTSQLNLSRFWY